MAERREATVTQINNYIKAIIERTEVLQNVWIKGEISNLKYHSSGHVYLTLKDEGGALRAVMFKGAVMKLPFKMENGMKVSANGRIGVFERDGAYQLYIETMEQEGQGDLFKKLEELRKKLSLEGLFDERHKKPIPRYPQKVGVVTSPTGAAVRDILNILKRRYPLCEVYLYPALVQGVNAAESIARGIEFFNRENMVDVIIAGRGGGSIEDLWAFNEEVTVRAIFASGIPVISAVGHETDFTLSDAVADLRAPTPSAAAEIAVPDSEELTLALDKYRVRLKTLLLKKAEESETKLRLISERASRESFLRRIENLMVTTDRTFDLLLKSFEGKVERKTALLSQSAAKLDALSPLKVFDRGYSVAYHKDKVLKSVKEIENNDTIHLVLKDGRVEAQVGRIEEAL
ncbi:MAG: exodeoxyribonuclease VII large subunit [Clostridia bacterium]|nr:exodeoxyribonuclease VII large subunit [Clostridia bacterium]